MNDSAVITSQPERMAIYTALFGDRDVLHDPAIVDERADYICFTDRPRRTDVWDLRIVTEIDDPRRQARQLKLQPERYLPGHGAWLWVDGSLRLLTRLDPFLAVTSGGAEIARFRHPSIDCVYEDAEHLIALRRDAESTIRRQVERYRVEEFPEGHGYSETGLLFRRRTDGVRQFNERWWNELSRGSIRDQLSFEYVLQRSDVKHTLFPGYRYCSPLIEDRGHADDAYDSLLPHWQLRGGTADRSIPRRLWKAITPRLSSVTTTLECGSGLSTWLFDAMGTRHTALEHDPNWYVRTNWRRLRETTHLLFAPLTGTPSWFDWEPGGPVDLIVVDGPDHRDGWTELIHRIDRLCHAETQVVITDVHQPHGRNFVMEATHRLRREAVMVECEQGRRAAIV